MKNFKIITTVFTAVLLSACLNPGDETLIKSETQAGIIFTHIPTTDVSSGFSPDDANADYRNAAGTNIYKLSPASPQGIITNLTEEWTMGKSTAQFRYPGAAMDPEISRNNQKMIFSMKQGSDDDKYKNCYNIYELNLSNQELTRITGHSDENSGIDCKGNSEGNNYSPAYLPDGRIVFTSTRNHIADEYERREAPQLFIGERHDDQAEENEKGFASIMQVSFNQSFDQNPMVHSSGKIYFCRWEHLGDPNKMPIFTLNPDGTGLFVLYGNHSPVGGAAFLDIQETRDGRLVVSMMTRGSRIAGGALALIDITKSDQADDKINYITPGGSPYNGSDEEWLFRTPRPMMDDGEEKIIMAGAPGVTFENGRPTGLVNYGIYVIDKSGAEPRLIWDDPNGTEYDPIPLEDPDLKINIVQNSDYKSPFIPQSLQNPDNPTGFFFTTDIRKRAGNDGQVSDIETMSRATYIRILEAVELPETYRQDGQTINHTGGDIGNTNQEKQNVIGYGSIRDDYSFSIEVPANKSMHMQILDENGMMLVNQKTWVQVLSGERRVCTGCHNSHDEDDAIFQHQVIDDVDPLGIIQRTTDNYIYESSFANAEKVTEHPAVLQDTLDFANRFPQFAYKEHTVQNVLNNNCTECHNASNSSGGLNFVWDQSLDSKDDDGNPDLRAPTHVYEALHGEDMNMSGDSEFWVTDDGARRSPLMWVMFNKNLSASDDDPSDYSMSPSYDHTALWATNDEGRIDPFLPSNRDLLTLIEWIDAGTQYSNTVGYGDGNY